MSEAMGRDVRRAEMAVSRAEQQAGYDRAYRRRRDGTHLRRAERDPEPPASAGYFCKDCGACFATPEELGRHMGVR